MKNTLILLLLAAAASAQPAPRVVDISAKRFEFTPTVITLKKDEPVTIRLSSLDRSHGLLIDALGVDLTRLVVRFGIDSNKLVNEARECRDLDAFLLRLTSGRRCRARPVAEHAADGQHGRNRC